MNKNDGLQVIVNDAKIYKRNLENKNLMFIFLNRENNKYSYLETSFLSRNFCHLTGVNTDLNPTEFYHKALDNKLALNDFTFKNNGTTELKLKVLYSLMNIKQSAKMLSDYNNTKPRLYTNKLIGGIRGVLGFTLNGKYYIPNTALNDDIRKISKKTNPIEIICEKAIKDKKYFKITFENRNLNYMNIQLPHDLIFKLDNSIITYIQMREQVAFGEVKKI